VNVTLENIRVDTIKNLYHPYGVAVDVLRLDLIHPQISGNKWFKLMNYLMEAGKIQQNTILTFGGAYSNHILATAVACQQSGFNSIGIIRGERPDAFNPTLTDAKNSGMELIFVSREEYRAKKIPETVSPESFYMINEGGYGLPGRMGAESIIAFIDPLAYSDIIAACGTGTTLAGLVNAASPVQQITGISVLNNKGSIADEINGLLPVEKHDQFNMVYDFHFGGYAKFNQGLLDFMNDWFSKTGIPSDFVYTGKLFYAVDRLIKQGRWSPGSRLLLIHSGGLQGNRSLDPRKLNFPSG
jgi:1-aminocyclopropane-1-carboxylate deaminase